MVCEGFGKMLGECRGALCEICAPQLAGMTNEKRQKLVFYCHQCERMKTKGRFEMYRVSVNVL